VERLAERLHTAGIEGARREAFWLVEAATGLSRSEIVASRPGVNTEQVRRAEEFAERRCAGEPLQYVTGVAGFRSIELSVGPGVLIPRPETEVVVEQAIKRLPHAGRLVDVGTGSGAIALAVATERRDARVIGTESSPDALRWARQNAERLGLDVELVECDLLDGLGEPLRRAVDVVVSNPPYVAESERDSLPPEVVDHEPHSALFAGSDGLEVIRRLAHDARKWIKSGGWLVLETAGDRAAPVAEELQRLGYESVAIRNDLNRLERIAEGRVRD
jgi:release factor glutamine methyltransferase